MRRGLHFLPVCVRMCVCASVCVCVCACAHVYAYVRVHVRVRVCDVQKMLKFLNGLFCGFLS